MTGLSYVEHRPRAELARFLECVWEVSDPRARADRSPERVVPDGCPELIVHLRDRFARRVDGRWRVQPQAFLAGTLTQPWLLRAGRRVQTLGLRFRPGATTALFRLTMAVATNHELPLAELAGRGPARELVFALRRARTQARRVRAAEDWLLARLAQAPRRAESARPAVDLILKARGNARIQSVAIALGWGRRRLERAFQRDLGIHPKLYARIVRLNAVLASLGEAERVKAVDLALEAGYFDQSHLLREFRLLAGRGPRTGSAADGEMARHFTHPERLRALLLGE